MAAGDHGDDLGGAFRAVAVGEQLGQVMPDEGRSEQFGGVVDDGPVADRVHGAADGRDWGVVNFDDRMPGL